MLEGWIVYPPAVALAVALALRARRRGAAGFIVAATALFVLYLGWLASAALFPIPVDPAVRAVESEGRPIAVQLAPLRGIRDLLEGSTRAAIVWLVGGNILVFVPFGFMLPLLWERARGWRRALLAGFALSFGIEAVQLTVSLRVGYAYRVTELDDVLLNVLGVLLGYLLYRLVWPRRPGSGGGLAADQQPEYSASRSL
jgi:glycopeptide antibiotics resistance protein